MMKSILTTILFLIFCVHLNGQNEANTYKIVYLHDGSVLKGSILEPNTSTDGISIQILNGELLYIEHDHISKISEPKSRLQYIDHGRSVKPKGRYYALHFNLLSNYQLPAKDNVDPRVDLGMHFVMGHKFSEKAAVGLGVGIDKYPNQALVPLFVDFRGAWDKGQKKVALAYNLMLGYSFHTGLVSPTSGNQKRYGGVMIYPNIGMRIARRKSSNLFVDLGYKFQFDKFEYSTNNWWWGGEYFNTERRWYKSIALRFGWEF